MAYQSVWYFTSLPKDIVEILEKDLKRTFDDELKPSKLGGDKINEKVRNSKNAWIPTSHWVGGLIWHYVQKANRSNFLYDLSHIDGETIQYTKYGVGDYYNWHTDQDIRVIETPNELVRKLSFTLQLSDENEYTGGNLEFADFDNSKNKFIAPRTRGCLIIFDSRVPHRVCPVKSGLRKSLVGWVMGKRWR